MYHGFNFDFNMKKYQHFPLRLSFSIRITTYEVSNPRINNYSSLWSSKQGSCCQSQLQTKYFVTSIAVLDKYLLKYTVAVANYNVRW